MTMGNLALVFPGQGSQSVGMGKDLANAYTEAAAAFAQADQALGFSLSRLCFEGPAEELNDTANAQPALLAAGIAALRALQSEFGQSAQPQVVAGHSVGEYAALVASGALGFPDALRLVRQRGLLMKQAGENTSGGMAAVIGGEWEDIDRLCKRLADENGWVLQIANDNCPGQVVVAGDDPALEAFAAQGKAVGVKIFKRLAVSVACHTERMRAAQYELDRALAASPVKEASVPLCANVSGQVITGAADIRAELAGQLCSPVQWTRSVRAMTALGATRFIEIGAGSVLQGLIRRIEAGAVCTGFATAEDVAGVKALLEG
ncbi:MAG: ACP S-malonyltransferase [Anaerolineae bacterium]|nr:ACP S-malonyltransferase [Anaerolineae bacterium]